MPMDLRVCPSAARANTYHPGTGQVRAPGPMGETSYTVTTAAGADLRLCPLAARANTQVRPYKFNY